MTSDVFFAAHISRRYDIVFIDGLHTAHQVSKDIQNTILNLNDGGWIVLDDVYPHCEKEQERLDLRKSGAQTGDVWKAVYDNLNAIVDMSETIYFQPNTERGSLIFRLKHKGTITSDDSNFTIDSSIPICNTDGWYTGADAEWNKYTYARDFPDYISRLLQFRPIV
jgi:hypothetical protein